MDFHHYVPAASAEVPPDCEPFVYAVLPLGDGTFLWKLHHADPALSADAAGALVRVLPAAVAKHARGAALGSAQAAELIAKLAIAAADDKTLAEIAEAMEVDISERSRSEARAKLSARVAVAGVEVAPMAVIVNTQPDLAYDIVMASGKDEAEITEADVKAALADLAAAKLDPKLADAGAVEEVGP